MGKTKVTVYLDKQVALRLSKTARRSGITRGELIERALHRFQNDEVLDLGPVGAEHKAQYLRARGPTIFAIAVWLNDKGYRTSRGKEWTYFTVQRMLARRYSGDA